MTPCLIQGDQRATGVPIEVPETNQENGEAWWIRTTDSLLKRQELYLAELTPHANHSAQLHDYGQARSRQVCPQVSP
jgi:hypothetical protein